MNSMEIKLNVIKLNNKVTVKGKLDVFIQLFKTTL